MTFAPSKHKSNIAERIQLAELLSILRYRRPFGSETEHQFIQRFISPLGPQVMASNQVVRIPLPDGSHSKTLFSCHTDTVHHEEGLQKVVLDVEFGVVYKDDNQPLGADDGSGVFLLLHMIRRGIPGTYVFHTGEERGGIGSALFAEMEPAFLQQFHRAIAFDRKGQEDVITHQGWSRCCSQEFASALALALNEADAGKAFDYAPCDTGVFTDTANYTALIPECTNISVGYEGEHTRAEMQDVNHLLALADAVVKIDWESLPTDRVAEEEMYGYSWMDKDYYGSRLSTIDGKQEDRYAAAMEAASDFFGVLHEAGMSRAYHELRFDQVVDMYIEAPSEFEELYDGICNGHYDQRDEDSIMDFVCGY